MRAARSSPRCSRGPTAPCTRARRAGGTASSWARIRAGVKTTFLEFEQPIAELETRIEELRYVQDDSAVDISEEIQRLTKRSAALTKDIYGKLNSWQAALVARHPQRPYTLDYVQALFTHFEELHGDRTFADDPSIVGGLARFAGEPCMIIGHQKGRDTKEKILRNFGMPKPEGYRKALRKALAEALKQLSEKKPKELVEERLERLMSYGKFKEAGER